MNVRLGSRGKLLGALLGKGRKVEACSGQEVLGLTNIHPEALEVERMELTILADGGESLLLNRCRAQLNAVEDAWVEDVDTSVDPVTNELDGLLDEAVDS